MLVTHHGTSFLPPILFKYRSPSAMCSSLVDMLFSNNSSGRHVNHVSANLDADEFFTTGSIDECFPRESASVRVRIRRIVTRYKTSTINNVVTRRL